MSAADRVKHLTAQWPAAVSDRVHLREVAGPDLRHAGVRRPLDGGRRQLRIAKAQTRTLHRDGVVVRRRPVDHSSHTITIETSATSSFLRVPDSRRWTRRRRSWAALMPSSAIHGLSPRSWSARNQWASVSVRDRTRRRAAPSRAVSAGSPPRAPSRHERRRVVEVVAVGQRKRRRSSSSSRTMKTQASPQATACQVAASHAGRERRGRQSVANEPVRQRLARKPGQIAQGQRVGPAAAIRRGTRRASVQRVGAHRHGRPAERVGEDAAPTP